VRVAAALIVHRVRSVRIVNRVMGVISAAPVVHARDVMDAPRVQSVLTVKIV